MSHLEVKYILLLSPRLQKFKKRSGNLFNFRCPFCGDSEKNKHKARAYLFEKLGTFRFYCHNCMLSLRFEPFLKRFDNGVYEHYLMEKLSDSEPDTFDFTKERMQAPLNNDALNQLQRVINLPEGHEARAYIINRRIPLEFFSSLYYCEAFKAWTNNQLPRKFETLDHDEPRIVIPMCGKDGVMFGYQGRAIHTTDKTLRYISIMLDETKPKIYGLDRVNFNYRYYATEGPFDSMFLPNAIATAGGKITSELIKAKASLENLVVVYDNEPRNPNIVKAIKGAVMSNLKTVIWPNDMKEKDINDMRKSGLTLQQIKDIVDRQTFQGLEAELELRRWVR